MNIYVGNISWNLKDQDLANLFASYGEVTSAKIVTDKFTNRSKGFGFVEMADDAAAQAAIAALNGSEVDGRNIVVNESRPKPEGGGGGGFKKASVAAVAVAIRRRWRWLQPWSWRPWRIQQRLLICPVIKTL